MKRKNQNKRIEGQIASAHNEINDGNIPLYSHEMRIDFVLFSIQRHQYKNGRLSKHIDLLTIFIEFVRARNKIKTKISIVLLVLSEVLSTVS